MSVLRHKRDQFNERLLCGRRITFGEAEGGGATLSLLLGLVEQARESLTSPVVERSAEQQISGELLPHANALFLSPLALAQLESIKVRAKRLARCRRQDSTHVAKAQQRRPSQMTASVAGQKEERICGEGTNGEKLIKQSG